MIVSFAAAVPPIIGVVVAMWLSSAGAVMTGEGGREVLMVKLIRADAGEVLPAASVTVALTVCAAWLRAGGL